MRLKKSMLKQNECWTGSEAGERLTLVTKNNDGCPCENQVVATVIVISYRSY